MENYHDVNFSWLMKSSIYKECNWDVNEFYLEKIFQLLIPDFEDFGTIMLAEFFKVGVPLSCFGFTFISTKLLKFLVEPGIFNGTYAS